MARRLVCLGVATLLLCSGLMMGGSAGDGYLWWGHREPIYIYGDRAFTPGNGVVAGCGTRDNPYIIEGWKIVPDRAGFGIYIDHTTRYFVIRNCMVEGARGAAIQFSTVVNGRIEGCQLLRNECGVLLENSHYNAIVGNLIAENRYGVQMRASSRENTVVDNSFIWNGLAGHDPERRTLWYCGTRGNFWSDYEGCDYNGDGIGDRPYSCLGDRYPLMVSPMAAALPLCYHDAAHCLASTDVCEVGSWQDLDCDGLPDPCLPQCGIAPPGPCIPPIGGCLPPPQCVPADPCAPPVPCPPLDPCAPRPPAPPPCAPPDGDTAVVINTMTPITLYAEDAHSGVACMYFAVDGGEWTPYQGPFTVTGAPGPRTIAYYAVDNIGNHSVVRSFVVILDPCPPETMHGIGEPRVTIENGLMVPVPPPCEDGIEEPMSMDAGASEVAPADTPSTAPAEASAEEEHVQTPSATPELSPPQTDSENTSE